MSGSTRPPRTCRCSAAEGESSLADYKGKVVVLNFWASWCKPCTEELPLLERTHKAIAGRNATVLGANYQDVSDSALQFVRRFKLTYPSLRDRDGEYADRYGSRAFPETFVIDRRGRIAAQRRGPVDQEWLDETLHAAAGGEGVRIALLAARCSCSRPAPRRRPRCPTSRTR